MDGYDWGQPYDPDMTVQEALEAGLIAVFDGSNQYQRSLCGYEGPWQPGDGAYVTCTREQGHPGHHAHMVRWELSYRDQQAALREQERRDRMDQERRAAADRRMNEELAAVQASMKDFDNAMKKAADWASQEINREFSKVYGPGVPKDAQFRDHHTGKVRKR